MKKLLLICLLLLPLASIADTFTPDQKRLMSIAYIEGIQVGWPETIQAILLQETRAGVFGPVGDIGNGVGLRSYCPMQIKVATARDMVERYQMGVFPTDEELIAKLLTDDSFCIRVGAKYFEYLYSIFRDWKTAVIAYNVGPAGVKLGKDPNNYGEVVWKHILTNVRPFNKEMGLSSISLSK